MQEVRNLNDKRVGDISSDKKTYISKLKDCITKITANKDGTLNITHGKQLEYPVYMDNEAQPSSAKAGITEAAIAFCETMEADGYFVGIYGSAVSGFQERMDDSKLKAYSHWVAQYADKCTYSGEYGIWLYSSTGKVDGINRLNEMGIPTRMNKSWCQATISKMLRNEKYAGDLLLQKTFRADHLSKQTQKNRGELPQYFVQEAHEPIIDRATFEAVQEELSRRAAAVTVKSGSETVFTGKIRCGICGKNYRRKTTSTGFVWICATFNTKGKKHCASKQIPEETLKAECVAILGTDGFDSLVDPLS